MYIIAELGADSTITKYIESEDAPWAQNLIDTTGIDLSMFVKPQYNHETKDWQEYEEPYDLEIARTNKINLARQHFSDITAQALSDNADFEKYSWEPQRQEWLAYLQDVNANTPYCDALSSARGISKELLMDKIGSKISSLATIQGQLHAMEDSIKAATTKEELDAII